MRFEYTFVLRARLFIAMRMECENAFLRVLSPPPPTVPNDPSLGDAGSTSKPARGRPSMTEPETVEVSIKLSGALRS